MKRFTHTIKGIAFIVAVLFLAMILSPLNDAAASAGKKSRSGVVISREATDIWHSYEIRPNYNYYFSGPKSQPDFVIGIDDKYRLTSKLWKPVDLTPEMLKKWFNFTRQRVGISQDPYGAYIVDSNGERVGLWYSVKDWRLVGAATVGDDNTISVTRPAKPGAGGGGMRGKGMIDF